MTAQTAFDEAAIRALRAKSNEAIARHDFDTVASVFRGDARILASSGELMDGGDAIHSYFKRTFSDPAFVTAARNPQTIHVGGTTAAEEGSWEATWKPNVIRGKYLARWERGSEGWSTVAEFYVPLISQPAE
ncbi:YybH family protein [Mesorhizobium sp. CO1-1-8]|uniref:YybH family protein n=1 Tax=Mesorhizobium sp. CO1-1-8 TaxID=2876631 RepID=UPI001CD10BA5|nr:nuclear transport factor 2 family protein [Mesorhizobium sp. CO1-1-8]MBZ9772251.1 nuclear transport factor 2 family protein [Mesorhizobium sp. CO1-1-8]